MSKQIPAPKRHRYLLCPLCEQPFPPLELRQALRAEPRAARLSIEQAIREQHPEWLEEDGACPRCWAAFRDVMRVQQFIDKLKWPTS